MRGDLQKIDSVNKHEVKPYHMILLRLIKAKYIIFKKKFIHNFWRVNNNIISYFLQLEDKFQKTDFVNIEAFLFLRKTIDFFSKIRVYGLMFNTYL